VDYINRFKSAKDTTETLKKLANGEIDILVGTHAIVADRVKFKDLGLMIIDEEQKFGVAVKDKLKTIRTSVDTLTLTATPIPRTLQFSLMGARDLSIINTPPPNRQPVLTEIISFDEELLRDAISYEVTRGGQVFFVNNRLSNIREISGMISRLCPGVRVGIGHGQMDGKQLEKVMLDFIEGRYDVLLATTIIESGIDISNANTIIINDAQNFGLSVNNSVGLSVCPSDIPVPDDDDLDAAPGRILPPKEFTSSVFDDCDRLLVADLFEVFTHRHLRSSPKLVYSSNLDVHSVCKSSRTLLLLLQPSMRVRRFWAGFPRICNIEVIQFDEGVLYKCTLCKRLYSLTIACVVCVCMFCDVCEQLQPRYVDYFHNKRRLCSCPWALTC
jgi:hypothetical protein